MARPTKLTPELTAAFAESVETGHYFEDACALCDIDRSTGDNWMEWGAEGKEPYAEFFRVVKRAEAKAKDAALKNIRDAAGGPGAAPWQNRAWWLERRHPRQYGRQIQQVEHSGHVGIIRIEGLEAADEEALRKLAGRDEEQK